MASQRMQRTDHRDKFLPLNPPRQSPPVSHAEGSRDMDQFVRPLEQVHAGVTLHGWGVAAGLQVTATINSPGLHVLSGVALDVSGRHVSLADNGVAEIGQNADAPGASPTPTAVVPLTGVALPTAGLSGDKFVTIQFFETFDTDAFVNHSQYLYDHTPWLRLLDVVGFVDDGARIVLAKVSLSAGAVLGNVTVLGGGLRRGVDLPAESLHFRRPLETTPAPNVTIGHAPAGEIRARPQGGIQVKVQDPTDEIRLERDGGAFARVVMAATQVGALNQLTAGDLNNPGIVLDGPRAALTVGTQGNEGDVLVKDGANKLTVAINGSSGHLIVGGPSINGKVKMLDTNGVESLKLDGATGSAVVKRLDAMDGQSIDVGAPFFRIHGADLCLDGRSHRNNRALVDNTDQLIINFLKDYRRGVVIGGPVAVDGVLSANGIPLMGNPVRKVRTLRLDATAGESHRDIVLPTPTQFTAFCSLVMINATTDFDYDNAAYASITHVDGQPQASTFFGGNFGGLGDARNMRAPFVINGFGRVITFQAWATGPDIQCSALAVVFFE